jgi:NADPH-dependent curcumin reductase CurA
MSVNKEWIFVQRPVDAMSLSNFDLRECAMPAPKDGELLIQTHLMSIDPTMRNAMAGPSTVAAAEQKGVVYYDIMVRHFTTFLTWLICTFSAWLTFTQNWKLGEVISWTGVGIVVESKAEGFKAGDLVSCSAPWRIYNTLKAKTVQRLDSSIPPESHLGMLGGTGLAAYLPIKAFGRAKEGETAFVSGCAGATGSCAAQILLQLGLTVIGSAGTQEKVEMLTSLGVKAFNYKKESTLQALQRLAPEGIDIYFDNVGGETLEDALEVMNDLGRIIACGSISQYDTKPGSKYGIKNLFHIVAKRITFQVAPPPCFGKSQDTHPLPANPHAPSPLLPGFRYDARRAIYDARLWRSKRYTDTLAQRRHVKGYTYICRRVRACARGHHGAIQWSQHRQDARARTEDGNKIPPLGPASQQGGERAIRVN